VNHVRVAAGALLEYLPDPLIPFAGARYHQQTHIELAMNAGLFWWEVIAPGRIARGECFDYDMLKLDLDIFALSQPIAIERILLEPGTQSLTSHVRMGAYHYVGSFYICRPGMESVFWSHLENELSTLAKTLSCPGEILWGISSLPTHGLLVRVLGCRGEAITHGLHTFWRAARRALYGREALRPRKIY
jgi:urease accessory protein